MQVSIQHVTFPQPGRKYGKLQLTDGQTIWVPPDLLNMFRGGMTVEIATKQQTWGQGADARTVTIATTGPMQGQGGGQQGGSYGQSPQTQGGSYGGQRPNTGFQPRLIQGGGQRDPGEARMIFVTGVVGRAMGSGKFTASEIAILAQAASQAYELVTRPSPPPAQSVGMPEEPPTPDAFPEGA